MDSFHASQAASGSQPASRPNHTPAPRRLSAKQVADRRQLGADGETAAAQWYLEHGWEILARNWRCGRGELDIIASCELAGAGLAVAFCEVKTRSSTSFAWPSDAVNWKKQAQIRKLATSWLDQSRVFYPVVRFDVAEVTVNRGQLEVVMYEDAF